MNREPTVLVVDDNRVNRRLLTAILEKDGCRVIEAEDGAPGVELAREHLPDLILLDIMMPGTDGFQACRQLKADPVTQGIPVIFLSALSEVSNKVKGLTLGAVDYIPKPFERTEVVARVRSHLELQRLTRRLQERQKQIDEDLAAAAEIQRSLLPAALSEAKEVEIDWRFLPCERIGGDVFNFSTLDERHVSIYMIDVAGHGVPAAMVTVSVARSLSAETGYVVNKSSDSDGIEVRSPSEVLDRLDMEYPIERFGKHFTIAYLVLDRWTGVLRYSLGGHPPLLVVRANGTIEWLAEGGPLIGLGGLLPFDEGECQLQPGDRFFLYTDGIPEFECPQGTFFGEDRMAETLAKGTGLSLERACDDLLADLGDFGHGEAYQDDVTLLGVQFVGLAGGAKQPDCSSDVVESSPVARLVAV